MHSTIFGLLFTMAIVCKAQSSSVDRIKEQIRKDSVETEQQVKRIKEMRRKTDSLFHEQMEHINNATKRQDSIEMVDNLNALLASQKKAEE